ncbi:MAG: translation factor GTPase family protein [Eubacteriales bacterium]|nr:translation factor GTPase family protein [Eubacteriales bacterium]
MTRRHVVLAILAHVDAGKTTLGERILYRTGAVRTLGSVDRGDTHLDADAEERARGITIYATEARFSCENTDFTLIDTPGHADFAAETVRALAVTDCAVLVVSAPAGVQGHTRTLSRILASLGVPTVVFVNKTDLPCPAREETLAALGELGNALDFSDFAAAVSRGSFPDALRDALSLSDDALLEAFLEDRADAARCMASAREQFGARRVLPVLFGSAREGTGCDELLFLLDRLASSSFSTGGETPSGVCYKVARDDRGTRLALCRLASGRLRVRDELPGAGKLTELRVFDGARAAQVAEAGPGMLFAAAGVALAAGEAFGGYVPRPVPASVPSLSARVCTSSPVRETLSALRLLADEEPSMRVRFDESLGQIRAEVCGEIQLEVLSSRLKSRFGIDASFADPDVVYRETLAEPVIGRGHYEPLRHYAEVHLRLEPAPRGEGITFRSAVHTDVLAQSWQNLVRTHVLERTPRGVLTGSDVTDLRVTLIAARAHEKHTEGGDFREATYRAIRQGLLKGKSVLLEPYTAFSVDVPVEYGGRVLAELQKRGARCDPPENRGASLRIAGRAPTARLSMLSRDLASLTRGQASASLSFDGYEPVSDPSGAVRARGYDPFRDPEEDGNSVFCAHGAGFLVPWNEADRYMHLTDE